MFASKCGPEPSFQDVEITSSPDRTESFPKSRLTVGPFSVDFLNRKDLLSFFVSR